MPRLVVVYDSMSGNTEEMAKAVAEGASSVKGVEVRTYKIGTKLSVQVLAEADAIVLGTPSRYGLPTTEMREFLEAAGRRYERAGLAIKAKIGGVFGSYGWDGGDVVDRLEEALAALGVKVIPPKVAAIDRGGAMGIRIDEDSLKKCQELGKTLAKTIV